MSDKINDGGPAFPIQGGLGLNSTKGMSLRDWFAGMALQGLLANPVHATHRDHIIPWAFEEADAMIAERNKNAHS